MKCIRTSKRSLNQLKNNKVLSLIGLATKAGKTVSGEFSTEKSVKQEKVSWHWWQRMPPKTQKEISEYVYLL